MNIFLRITYTALLVLLFLNGNILSQEIKEFHKRRMYSLFVEEDTIWVGCKAALYKLDTGGNVIKKYTVADGLPAGPYYSIAIVNNEKWIASDKGIIRLYNNNISLTDSVNGERIDSITDLKSDKYNNLWVGTRNNGLWKFNGSIWVNYNNENSNINILNISKIYIHNDTVFVGGHTGISWMVNNEFSQLGSYKDVYGIGVDKYGYIFFGCDKTGITVMTSSGTAINSGGYYMEYSCLKEIDGKIFCSDLISTSYITSSLNFSNFINANNIYDLYYDRHGNIWFINEYLNKYDKSVEKNNEFRLDDNQMASNSLSSIAIDYSGNLWVGSTKNSVSRFDGNSWKNFSLKDSTLINEVYKIYPVKNGDIWIGTYEGVFKIKGDEVTSFSTFPRKYIRDIISDKNDNIWVASVDYRVAQYDGVKWTEYNLGGIPVISICVDKNNTIWAGTSYGLYSYDGNKWTRYSEGFPTNYMTKVCTDTAGNVWCFGNDNRFCDLKNNKIYNFPAVNSDNFKDAYFDANNNLVILGYYSLNRFDGQNWMKIKKDIISFTTLPVDYNGKVLFGINGIYYYNPDECKEADMGPLVVDDLICEGKANYPVLRNVPPNLNYTLNWLFPDGYKISTYNSQSIQWFPLNHNSGSIKVTFTSLCGIGKEFSTDIRIKPLPSLLSGFTGRQKVCAGDMKVVYSVDNDSLSENYLWKFKNQFSETTKSNSVSIDFDVNSTSGKIIVNGSNICGVGPQQVYPITIQKMKPSVDSILGPLQICSNNNYLNYSVSTKDIGLTYQWNLPSGVSGAANLKNVYLTFDTTFHKGIIQVITENGCGKVENQIEVKQSFLTKPTIIKKWDDLLICSNSSKKNNFYWYLNNKLLESKNAYILAKSIGNYKLIESNSDGCVDSAFYTFRENATSEVSVSPNPFISSIKLILSNFETGNADAKLIDIKGNIVRHYSFYVNSKNEEIDLKADEIHSGVYLLDIKINNHTRTLRVLKK